jgi:hypothetical protein
MIQVDERATAINAETLLQQYPHERARALVKQSLASPRLDGMPKTSTASNATERRVVGVMESEQFVKRCDSVLNQVRIICGDGYADALRYLYFKPMPTLRDVAGRLSVSASTLTRWRKAALVEFAKCWPGQWGELVVLVS